MIDSGLACWNGGGHTRQEDVEVLPTQSRTSPSILVCEDLSDSWLNSIRVRIHCLGSFLHEYPTLSRLSAGMRTTLLQVLLNVWNTRLCTNSHRDDSTFQTRLSLRTCGASNRTCESNKRRNSQVWGGAEDGDSCGANAPLSAPAKIGSIQTWSWFYRPSKRHVDSTICRFEEARKMGIHVEPTPLFGDALEAAAAYALTVKSACVWGKESRNWKMQAKGRNWSRPVMRGSQLGDWGQAKIWPCLSYMCHAGSTAECLRCSPESYKRRLSV